MWGAHNTENGSTQSGIGVTHGGTAFSESQTIETTDRTGYKTPYFWFTVWTAANEDLAVEYYSSNASYTARVEDVTLLAINAEDLIANGDLQYNIQPTNGGDGTLTATPTPKATKTWTPDNDGDTWWVMAYSQADIEDINGALFQARIDIDGTDRAVQEIEGDQAIDTPLYGLGWVTILDNSSHTVAIELSESENNQEWDAAGIFALRLNAFAQFATDATAGIGPDLTVSGTWVEQAGVDPDVALEGDWLIAAGAIGDDNNERIQTRIQLGGTDITDPDGTGG